MVRQEVLDLKSIGPIGPWGFESPPRRQRGVCLING